MLCTSRIVRTAVGELHEALVADADSLATVMAGITGFTGNSRIFEPIYSDFRLPGGLQAMGQQLTGDVPVDSRITTLVSAFVTVRYVAGRTARAPVVPTFFAPGHTDMATLALLSGIGDTRLVGVCGNSCDIDFRDLLEFQRHLIRVRFRELNHVGLVSFGANRWSVTISILDIVVSPDNGMILL